jgi:hypothetical protein
LKQSITQAQYEELSDQARQVYIAWTLAKSKETGDHTTVYRSIGHLIWFLDEHITGWWRIERSSTKDAWRVQAAYTNFDDEGKPTLRDALWDAVKVILEDEEAQPSKK